MIWARAALTGGLLVLLATFAIGTEKELSTSVVGQPRECGPAISASWLVSGTPDQAQPAPAAINDSQAPTDDDEQRAAAACEAVIHEFRVLLLTIMVLGGLLALVGWTARGARRQPVPPRTVTTART